MPIAIRDLRDEDAPALARLRLAWRLEREPGLEVDPAPFEREVVAWWARQRSYLGALAVDGDVPVGVGLLYVVPRPPEPGRTDRRHGELQSVYVRPEHRGEGVGTRLVARLLERADELDCLRVTVRSSSGAVRLYERAGFAASPRLLLRPAAGTPGGARRGD